MIFRQSPDTFTVEEIPLYGCSGEGEHLYVTFRRKGMSTGYILRLLQKELRLKEVETGRAGNKDRDATAVQTISLPARVEERVEDALIDLGAEVLTMKRHGHKLRTGKLAGNRFTVNLELEKADEKEKLQAACNRISSQGMPNAFGPQRFGDGSVVEEGKLLFTGNRRGGSFRRSSFAVSAFQARVFNRLLEVRRERGLYPSPIPGDLMKKHSSGGQFIAEKVDDELLLRVEELEVSPTGPLPGRKVEWPDSEALALEKEVLLEFDIDRNTLTATKAPGTRRLLRVLVGELECALPEDEQPDQPRSALLTFSLPPGSYATVLLAELGVRLVKPERAKG